MKQLQNAKLIPLDLLVPCTPEDNPNKMTATEHAMLTESMRHTTAGEDVLDPLLVSPRDDGQFDIVDGMHRFISAREIGWEEIGAIVHKMTSAEIIAYRIGLNRQRGKIDLLTARTNLIDLTLEGWDAAQMTVTGFSADEITDLVAPIDSDSAQLSDAGSTDVEDEAAPSAKPFVLEIPFASKADYQLVKRRLRKAAGKTRDLARGLLAVLGEEK